MSATIRKLASFETTTAEDTLKAKSRDASVISGGHLVATGTVLDRDGR